MGINAIDIVYFKNNGLDYMYEDFNYIADDNFLRNYWSHEQVICRKCQGNGKLTREENEGMISCPLCEETGKVHRHQQKDIAAA
ncbi:MAG: hypothetical protein WBM32_21140 [Crocosphaera sp.]